MIIITRSFIVRSLKAPYHVSHVKKNYFKDVYPNIFKLSMSLGGKYLTIITKHLHNFVNVKQNLKNLHSRLQKYLIIWFIGLIKCLLHSFCKYTRRFTPRENFNTQWRDPTNLLRFSFVIEIISSFSQKSPWNISFNSDASASHGILLSLVIPNSSKNTFTCQSPISPLRPRPLQMRLSSIFSSESTPSVTQLRYPFIHINNGDRHLRWELEIENLDGWMEPNIYVESLISPSC